MFDRSTLEKENFFKLFDILTTLCQTGRGKGKITPIEREVLKGVQESETFVAVKAS